MTRKALIREADLRRLVKVVVQEAPGTRMTFDLLQNRLHFDLSDMPANTPEGGFANPLDWLLNGNETQTRAPK